MTLTDRDKYVKAKIMIRTGATQEIIDRIRYGINEVMPLCWLGLFSVEEFGQLLTGSNDRINVAGWIKRTNHINEANHPNIIGWFWQIVRILSTEAQYKLLTFWTALGRLPMAGFDGCKAFRLKVIPDGNLRNLPTANTCPQQLNIPAYPSKQIMFDKLVQTIYLQAIGFQVG